MDFRILGPLEVAHAGAPIALGGPRHRKLLAVLLIHADEIVRPGRLIEALWGDDPPRSASAMLHVRVSELRAALRAGRTDGDAGLDLRGGGYVLRVGADGLDARRFERLAAAGARALAAGDVERARTDLTNALALWRGPALAEVAGEPFALGEAARLEALRLRGLEHRIEADLALGRHADLIAELTQLVAEHPMLERFWGQLMLAQYRAGQQAEALTAYRRARDLLIEQLGIDPGADLQRLQAAILRQDPALEVHRSASTSRRAAPPGNLPTPLTSFVGRWRELADVRAALRASRLVTLTGVGGAGKSRLAIEAATACRADFPDGVWLVELAAVSQPDMVTREVAATLGLREHVQRPSLDVLVEHLRTADLLVVLDNCEHLVAEVAGAVDRLLRACAGLRILATSRERLGITGEVLRPVGGLSLAAPEVGGPTVIAQSEAVRLLVERATAVQPEFELSAVTAAIAGQICEHLDGLPLAIELAAAAVNTFGLEPIATGLDDRFRLLTRGSRTALPRHQTLRAVVDWSYERLSAAQRVLFNRLTVFAGWFTVDAAVAVCAEPDDSASALADVLARLVEQSLVVTEHTPAGSPSYRLLETLRVYGLERLDHSGETAKVRDRHAQYVRRLVESAAGPLQGPDQPQWLHRLESEHGNIRAALDWSIERGDAVTAVRLAGSLYPLWDRHGHYREGLRWIDRVLALPDPAPTVDYARVLTSAAGLAVVMGDLDRANAAAAAAAGLSRTAGDPAGVAHALLHLGLAAIYADDPDRSLAILEESLRNAQQAGDRWLEGFAWLFLATEALARGDAVATARLSAACEDVLRQVGDPEGLAWSRILRAAANWLDGDLADAARLLRDATGRFQTLDHVWGLSLCLFLAGVLAGETGQHERGMALLGASEALHGSVGAAVLPFVRTWITAAVGRAQVVLDPATFERAWQRGRAMPPDAALAYAMPDVDPARPADHASWR